jgi:hypothetical protein
MSTRLLRLQHRPCTTGCPAAWLQCPSTRASASWWCVPRPRTVLFAQPLVPASTGTSCKHTPTLNEMKQQRSPLHPLRQRKGPSLGAMASLQACCCHATVLKEHAACHAAGAAARGGGRVPAAAAARAAAAAAAAVDLWPGCRWQLRLRQQ